MDKIPVLAVVGPTASGKTALAAALAKHYGAEVVSADSMQIYRGMDIATAKPTPQETLGVPHHLLGFLPPDETYSVAAFCTDANRAVDGIISRGNRVIVCGGTGLYVDALLSGMAFQPEPEDGDVRQRLSERYAREGAEALLAELAAIDPEAAAAVDVHNVKRLIRMLEIYYLTGEKPSVVRARATEAESRFTNLYLGLFFHDRQLLYDRIDRRVDRMLADGLIEEACSFYGSPAALTASQAIGYKELEPYLDGVLTLDEAADNLKRATRRYAKRQLTWFGRNERIHRIYRDGLSDAALFAEAVRIVDENGIFKEK